MLYKFQLGATSHYQGVAVALPFLDSSPSQNLACKKEQESWAARTIVWLFNGGDSLNKKS